MNDQRPPPIVLKRVEIRGLFGRYNHAFDLATNEGVTIVHGPNGVGKTAILRLLFAIFSGRLFEVFSIKFESLTLSFEGHESFAISRVLRAEGPSSSEHISVQVVDRLGLESTEEILIDQRVLRKFASSIARRWPWIERVEDEVWLDRRTEERLTSAELLIRYEANDADRPANLPTSDQVRPIVRVQELVKGLADRIDVHIIETQRLLRKGKKERRPSYKTLDDGDSEVRTTVNDCAEEVKLRIGRSLNRYATESQRRDQTFPMRLLAPRHHGPMDREGLRERLKGLAEKRQQLADVGLLVDRTDQVDVQSLEGLDLESADDSQLRVIELYADDTAGKLDTLDELLQVSRVFIQVLNSRFRHKRIALDRERGLVAQTEDHDTLRLDALSSGEQHQLVMFFDLLFKVREGSLVLIDEPELSLHVSWQKSLLDSLVEIARANGLTVLIATHSPYIVGGRVDLMRELSSDEYSLDAAI